MGAIATDLSDKVVLHQIIQEMKIQPYYIVEMEAGVALKIF
jgi:hypothetical protein